MPKEEYRPEIMALEVTRRCPCDCKHCRAGSGSDAVEELSTQQWKRILTSIADFCKCLIIITGGEPMERDDIFEIVHCSRELGLETAMATCGYKINAETISRLKDEGIRALSFSLDGAIAQTHDGFRQTKGAFDTVIKAAEAARKAGVRFQINTTISKLNIDEFFGIAEMAQRLGASCFNPFILVPTGRGREISEAILDPVEYEMVLGELLKIKLESQIKVRVTCGPQFGRVMQQQKVDKINYGRGCMGGKGFGFISYKGDVQTCGFLDVSAGNLIENNYDFAKVWLESEFLNEIRNRTSYTGKCSICEYMNVCGGCRARAYAMVGDYLGNDPVCAHQPGRRVKD